MYDIEEGGADGARNTGNCRIGAERGAEHCWGCNALRNTLIT